jgi:tetratricopeptide (TPR) repeat protein
MNIDLLQGTLEQRKQALAGLETLVQRYRTSPSPEVRVWVVSALVNLADETQETPSKAIAYADDALTLTSTLTADVQERWKADATLKKTGSLFKLGKIDEALSLSRSLVEAHYNSSNVIQRRIAARAALNTLVQQRDTSPRKLTDIEATNHDIQTKFAKESDPSIRAFMFQALLVFGLAHESTPKYIEAFNEIERRLAQDPTTMVDKDSFAVLRGLATMHALTNNEIKSIEYLNKIDELLESSKNNNQLTLSNEINRSDMYATQVYILQILGNKYFDRVLEIISKIDIEFSKSNEPNIIENILWANRSYIGSIMKKSSNARESALVIINSMIQRYGNQLDPKIAGELAITYVNRIVAYSNLQPPRNNGILEDSDLVVSRYQDSQNPAVRAQVAKALTLRSGALQRSNQPGAIQTLEKLIALYGADTDPRVVEWVTKGREALRLLTLPAVPALPAPGAPKL